MVDSKSAILTVILLFGPFAASSSPPPSTPAPSQPADLARMEEDLVTSKQESASGEMRTIASAIEYYQIREKIYPTTGAQLKELVAIKDRLQPGLLKYLSVLDPFGSPYLYWSDGQHYVLISRGLTGVGDQAYDRVMKGSLREFQNGICHGRITDPQQDLVFVDGQFCQWHMPKSLGGS